MLSKPFSKLTGFLAAITAYVAAQSHAVLVDSLDNFMPVVLAAPVAHILLGVCLLVTYFSHSGNGTGGASSPNAPKSLLSNLTRR